MSALSQGSPICNLITRGDQEAEIAKNIRKREVAIAQLLTHVRDVIGKTMPTIKGVVIGGDFNTNHDQAMFRAERTLDSLTEAGYQNGFEGLALSERVTTNTARCPTGCDTTPPKEEKASLIRAYFSNEL